MHKYIEQNEDLIEHFAPLEVKHLLNELNCSIIISEIKKDEHILIEGSSCDTLTYIIKGSFRQYTEAKGAEINFLFYFENDFVLDYLSFLKATPSKYSILAIENSVVLQINRTDLDSLKEKNVLWNIFLKNVAEKLFLSYRILRKRKRLKILHFFYIKEMKYY